MSASGKKDGEGGIAFENEGEKEQWEEDQKVSDHITQTRSWRLPALVAECLPVCSKRTETGT